MKHIKMPKKLADKWLADLRSGEYEQCYKRMTDGTRFCCLGVLQMGISGEIIKEEGVELPSKEWLRYKNIEFFDVLEGRGINPYCHNKKGTFSKINDGGTTFPEIADLLEAEIEYNDR